MEVVTPIPGHHVRHKEHHSHIDKHDDHIKERIFPISIDVNRLNHPTVDKDEQSHQVNENGVYRKHPLIELVDESSRFRNGISKDQIIKKLTKLYSFMLNK